MPFTHETVPSTTTSRICRQLVKSPTAQKSESVRVRLIQHSVYLLFCASNRSRSNFSRPNARTTRTPVRFSCAIVERTPSFSSHSVKRARILLWKSTE